MDNKIVSQAKLDALKEIINVGTGNAATALSLLIDRHVTIQVPHITVAPIARIPELLGGSEREITALFFRIKGDLDGSMLFFFSGQTSESLGEILTWLVNFKGQEDSKELKRSALMEMGNIFANSYLNAIGTMLEFKLLLSVPHYADDMLGAVVDTVLMEIAKDTDHALLLKTTIDSPDVKLDSSFIIFPSKASFKKIFDKIGMK